MYLSICLDRIPGERQADFKARAEELERLAPDIVLLARDEDGVLSPPRTEALVDIAWLTSVIPTPALVAGLPALHSMPFHVARALSAVDFLGAGRAGWMPLLGDRATFDAAYGADTRGAPGARADDFIRATRALWDSWDDDALVLDKAAGRYLDSTRVRRVDYRGAHFSTMGPLNAARPPQGHPLLVRDLDDRPDSDVAADILIGTTLPDVRRDSLRLLKVLADHRSAMSAIEEGGVDGLHLAGPSALDMLREVRAATPAPAAGTETARRRLNLPHPVNPFSAGVAA